MFDLLEPRAALLRRLRRFFDERGYLEVDTPVAAPSLIPEPSIKTFRTRFKSPFHGSVDLFLVPSPEVWMKRLIAAGSGSIYQISHCFRNAEQIGAHHNPEFTMLEWYTVETDYRGAIESLQALLGALAAESTERFPNAGALRPPIREMSMADAFAALAGIDLEAICESPAARRSVAEQHGISTANDAAFEETFHALFLQEVEPKLPRDRPLVIRDYPAGVRALARPIPGTPWCERWELYLDGVEIANCFTEAADPRDVRDYYSEQERAISEDPSAPPVDRELAEIMSGRFPLCSGVALGVDRLLMVLCGKSDVQGVIYFPFSAILSPYSDNQNRLQNKERP